MKTALFLLVLVIACFPFQAGAIEIEESDSFVGVADFNKVMTSLNKAMVSSGISPIQGEITSWYGPIPNIALNETWVYQNKVMKRTAYITEAEAMIVFEWDSVALGYWIWLIVSGNYEDMVAEISADSIGWLLTETTKSFSLYDSAFYGDVDLNDVTAYEVNVELKGSVNKVTGELSINGKFKGGAPYGMSMFSGTLKWKLPLANTAAASTPSGSKVLEKIEKMKNIKRFRKQGGRQ